MDPVESDRGGNPVARATKTTGRRAPPRESRAPGHPRSDEQSGLGLGAFDHNCVNRCVTFDPAGLVVYAGLRHAGSQGRLIAIEG